MKKKIWFIVGLLCLIILSITIVGNIIDNSNRSKAKLIFSTKSKHLSTSSPLLEVPTLTNIPIKPKSTFKEIMDYIKEILGSLAGFVMYFLERRKQKKVITNT